MTTNATRVSYQGLAFTAGHEGIVPALYYDSVRVPTWGIGHTASAGEPAPVRLSPLYPIGQELDARIRNALWLFAHDAQKYEAQIRKYITQPLSQEQFDAIFDWEYNTGAVSHATLTRLVNAGNFESASYEFAKWDIPPLPQRRAEEARLFRGEGYPKRNVNVWMTNGSGKVLWKPAKVIPVAQAVEMLRNVENQPAPTFR